MGVTTETVHTALEETRSKHGPENALDSPHAEPTSINRREITVYSDKISYHQQQENRAGVNPLNTRHLSLLALAAFLSIFVLLSVAVPAKSESGNQNARFTQVSYTARIPGDVRDTWTFVVYNANRSENDLGTARFFFKFYADKELWLDEHNSTQPVTWNCSKDSTVERRYNIRGGKLLAQLLMICGLNCTG